MSPWQTGEYPIILQIKNDEFVIFFYAVIARSEGIQQSWFLNRLLKAKLLRCVRSDANRASDETIKNSHEENEV